MCSYFIRFLSFFCFRKITPEEVGSIIIGYLLQMAENKTNSKISEIVLSVPAEFDSLQRNRTIAAAEMAGLC